MKKSQKLLFLIAIIVIVIITILIVLIQSNKKNKYNENIFDLGEDDGKGYVANKSFEKVDDYSIYFSAKNILNDYISFFEQINGDVEFEKGRIQLSDEELKKQRYEAGIRAVTQCLDDQYKNSETYNEEKIKSYVGKYRNTSGNSKYILYINEMYKADIEQNCILVLVYSKLNNNDFNCMIKMDFNSKRYTVFWDDYLEKNGYTKNRTEDINITGDLKDIENTDYNIFIPSYPSAQDISIRYFDDLKYKIKYNPNELYFDLLDEKYKEKRFPSTELFTEFITDINNRLDNMDIEQYKYEKNQISVVDNYENIYTFKISSVMEYKVLLDNYTIKNDELTELYNKSNEQGKVNSNIKEFFYMVNMKDYNGIYNKLDDTFKNNNFGTLNDLRSYIKQNLYDYCVIKETVNAEKDNNNYIYTVSFSDGKNKYAETKEITIVMQLKEETDYVISFSME